MTPPDEIPSNPNDPGWPKPENPYPSWQTPDSSGESAPSWQPSPNPYESAPPAAGWGQQPGQPGQQPYGYGAPSPYGPGGAPNDGGAIAAMVVGIVSLVFACGYGVGLLLSPVAIFLGRSAMKRIDASQGRLGGRGFAQAGFIMGIVGTIFLVLLLALVVLFVVLGLNGVFDTSNFSSENPDF